MELNIRNKWISFAGSSVVKDVNEKDVLKVQGKFFSWRRRKYVTDLDGKVIYQVRNRFWNFFVHECYVFDADENKVATLTTKFWSLHDHYRIDCKLGELIIRGNILGYNYHITLNGKEIGHVARRISMRDSFTLTLDDDQDPYFFVALVIGIDNIVDMRRNKQSSNN
ncbi:MAG: LURP-one-related family protein [Bacilli bacterium]|nr:LURP-one-related family protein [Bacilli bacterium]